MKPSLSITTWFIAAVTVVLSSCVSVNIPLNQTSRSKVYSFRTPEPPFIAKKGFDTDHVFQSAKTGNSIVVMSECSPSQEADLEQVINESFTVLVNKKPYEISYFQFNGRKAAKSEVIGEVDGVNTFHSIVVLSKNGCSYILSYVGLAKNYQKEELAFKSFLEGFVVP